MLINSSFYLVGSDSATDFDDIIVWSVLKSTLHEPNYKKKEVHWPSCSTNSGLRSAFFVLSFLARFVWVCMKYIHMHYWPSWGQNGWILAEFFFFFCIFGSEMKSQSNKQVETFCWLEIHTRRGCQWFPKVLCSPQRKGHQNNVALLPSTSCFVHFVPVLDGEKPERSCLLSKKGRRNRW